jgi:small subunit ribosomal protein S1
MLFKNKKNYRQENLYLMEIYNDLSNAASQEFEKLLNSQLSKIKIEEGKIIEGKINKITEKFVFLFIEGLKSEPVLDVNELKSMGLAEKIKIGETISVLLEKIEDKNGEVLVSASKAQKIKGWDKLVEAYEKNEPIMGKITSKCKGGCIVEHIDTGSLMFLPGSQISDKPLKDISHLMNEPQKFALIKLDKIRGNACVSRREIISSFKKEDKAKIIEKYKVGDIIKDAEVKGYSSFGCFFNVNGELDVLVHLQEISYSRVNHPDEVFNIGEKHDLKIISVDKEKLQVGCSKKQLSQDPFEHIENYELNKIYKVKVVKLMDFGAFCELEPGLITLLHSSELSWTKKNLVAKKLFNVDDEIDCVITEIDKDKRRIAISHRLTQENPFETIEKKYPVGTVVEGEVVNKNEYSLFVKIEGLDVDAFLHCNDLTYLNNGEEELAKYKTGDKITVKVLEIKAAEQKIRIGLRQTQPDPFDWFKDKKIKQTITVKIVSSDNKGLIVRPEGCEMDFHIKKNQIAINAADARPTRFTGGERIDCAISEIDFDKRKVTLSIKLLEEIEKKEALEKYGTEDSGKNLPFSSLSEDLKKKDEEKE